MFIVRILAYLLILAGLAVLGYDVVKLFETGSFSPVPLAQLWVWIDQSSQLGTAHFLERVFGSSFHTGFLVPYFWGAPAFLVFLILGVLLWLIFRRRD